jgi:ribosomal protein S18 acetylase RimI-like enzyme
MDVVACKIMDYRPEHQPSFERLNRAWIEEYFGMEPIDEAVLGKPEEHILQPGGAILMAEHEEAIVGTCALKFVRTGVYEFTKMAVDAQFRGLRIGLALAQAAIEKARGLGAHTIILYSNTRQAAAILLYRKLGFCEVPVDGPYKRANIKMELPLIPAQPNTYGIRRGTAEDAAELCAFSAKAFRDTFGAANTVEDMNLYVNANFTPEKLYQELTDPLSLFLTVYDGDTLAGYAKLRTGHEPAELDPRRGIEIERIYAGVAYLGKGVGLTLMDAAIHHARTQGFEVLWLGVWEHNLKARRFYEKHGFETFGSHIFMLGTDAQTDLLMKKKLY